MRCPDRRILHSPALAQLYQVDQIPSRALFLFGLLA
jgi:hypothetical protein